jgi:alkylation response protein AidB-like acyl-CoA dehydrogenase
MNMEFGFTEEQERLRREVHDFFMNELPEDYLPHTAAVSKELQSFTMQLQKKAGERGYLAPGWSKGSGGLGLGPIEQAIVEEESGYLGITWPSGAGLHIAGPAVHVFGTEDQKRRFLPPLAKGETIWMEVFTEPEAGSDEANIQLRAVEDGNCYILNGQKTFITSIYKPDYLYTLVRTAATTPKHRGLSLFLVSADLPGITFRPLPTMGSSDTNEVFFDDVRVPKDALLGELNQGFYHAMATFEFERSGFYMTAGFRRDFDEFVQFCKEEKRTGKPLIEDPEVRKALAQMAVEMEVWMLAVWYGVWWFSQREKLGPQPYDLTGFYSKIFNPKHSKMMMDILRDYGQLRKGSKWAKLAGRIEQRWQLARSLHGGGTVEVYKIVLAGRGLGLPRIPAKFNKEITVALQGNK